MGQMSDLLHMLRFNLMLEPLRANSKSIAAGCRSWHVFFTEVLGGPPERSLPPLDPQHVVMYLLMFKCGATGANYVNHVRSACQALSLSTAWHSEIIDAAKRNARMRGARLCIEGGEEAPVLEWQVFQRLVLLADSQGRVDVADDYVCWWEALLRVQSEGVPLQFGSSAEIERLPPGRHSAVFLESGAVHIRLARRKHRPQGSLLKRPCRCSEWGKHFCLLHRLEKRHKMVGSPACQRTAYECLRDLRCDLKALGVEKAEKYGLKAFRAGRATYMAQSGDSLGSILQMGEWRSAALLRYISETQLDKARFLQTALKEDDEADDAG